MLVPTTFDDDESVYASLQAGASGFLLKDVPPRELAEAIRIVAAGQSLLAPRVTRGIIERFVAQHPADKALQSRAELLSDREVEVLRFMGKGLTNAEIGEHLPLRESRPYCPSAQPMSVGRATVPLRGRLLRSGSSPR